MADLRRQGTLGVFGFGYFWDEPGGVFRGAEGLVVRSKGCEIKGAVKLLALFLQQFLQQWGVDCGKVS